jgi:hypothetical protein
LCKAWVRWYYIRGKLTHRRLDKNLTLAQEGGDRLGLGCSQSIILRCQSIYLEAHSALRHRLASSLRYPDGTHPQTIPQAVDTPAQTNTRYRARVKKRDPVPSQGSGGREIWVSFATRRTGLIVHVQLVRLSGADVRGGIVGPAVCIEDTDLQYCPPSVTTTVTKKIPCSLRGMRCLERSFATTLQLRWSPIFSVYSVPHVLHELPGR